MGFDKRIQSCHHHHTVIQNISMALKVPSELLLCTDSTSLRCAGQLPAYHLVPTWAICFYFFFLRPACFAINLCIYFISTSIFQLYDFVLFLLRWALWVSNILHIMYDLETLWQLIPSSFPSLDAIALFFFLFLIEERLTYTII